MQLKQQSHPSTIAYFCLLSLLLLLLLPVKPAGANEPAIRIEVSVQEGVFGMMVRAEGAKSPARMAVTVSSTDGQERNLRLMLSARDVFKKTLAWHKELNLNVPADGSPVEKPFTFPAQRGYYQIFATAKEHGKTYEASRGIGIIPPHHKGVRPDSFFASNTSSIRRGKQLQFLQMLGMKIQRTHLDPVRAKIPAQPDGALKMDLSMLDEALRDCVAHDTWVLPIVGYHFGRSMRSDLAKKTNMHGPPRDLCEFVETWEVILRRFPEITTYEFWNEPWIYGWTWAAEPQIYRDFQSRWCEMALQANPAMRIIVGNSSMFTEDHIEPYPDCWRGLVHGTSHHPYSGVGDPTFRISGQARSLDQGAIVTQRMGLPYYYMTESGSAAGDEIDVHKLVQYFVRSALAGAFQGNAQWGFGYHENNTRANTSFAVMTHFMEDRPVVADIWPHHELLWGAVFANARHATNAVRRLPRADELQSRWTVPVAPHRIEDPVKVAIVWNHTGKHAKHLDRKGTLTIDQPGDIRAYDLVGREIPRQDGRLVLPFGESVVWLTTESLGIVEFRKRIAEARMKNLTAVNAYALSLMRPAHEAQTLGVRLENQLNRTVSGTCTLARADDGQRRSTDFTIPAGRLAEVGIEWPAGDIKQQARHNISLELQTDSGTFRYDQDVALARFAKRSITTDGRLDDWEGVLPVWIDSFSQDGRVDPTRALLNPGKIETHEGTGGEVSLRVYTAYDAEHVYIAAAVREDTLQCRSGEPVTRRGPDGTVTLPYRMGEPEGLEHIRFCGDAFIFAFGMRDRVPEWGRQMDDPWAWKGHFNDTDYQYIAHSSTKGPQLIRQWGADTSRRTAYQTDKVPGVGPVPGAVIRIHRDEESRLTIYECAIPRSELSLFDPRDRRLRFGFNLVSNEIGWPLQWSAAANVFDYWIGSGSFSPSWVSLLPCQTFFGIEQ